MNGFAVRLPAAGELAGTATRIARLVNRPLVPVLQGVLLTAGESGLVIEGFNNDTALSRQIDAEVASPGTVLVSARLLAAVTGALPSGAVELAVEDGLLRVCCGSVRARLPLMPAEYYPERPALPELVGEVATSELQAATSRIAHAAAGEADDIAGLGGAHLHLDASRLRLCATDRYRLACVDIAFTPALSEAPPDLRLRVEHAPLHDTAKTVRSETVRLAVDDTLVGLVTDRERIVLRQLELKNKAGIDRALDNLTGDTALVCLPELAGALKRARAYGPTASVIVEVTEHTLTLSTSSQEFGDTVDTIGIDYTGPDAKFGINPDFFAAAVAALEGEQAAMTVPPAPNRPLQLVPLDDDGLPVGGQAQLVVPKKLPETVSTAA